jgi:hypothetical protein
MPPQQMTSAQEEQRQARAQQRRQANLRGSLPKRSISTPIDPEAMPFLVHEASLDLYQVEDQDRRETINTTYANQIQHWSSKVKGPKVRSGYEELVATQHPLQVIYPDTYRSSGLAYNASTEAMYATHNTIDDEENNNRWCFCFPRYPLYHEVEPILIYYTENKMESRKRYKITYGLLWSFMIITLAVAIITFMLGPFLYNNYRFFLHNTNNTFDLCNLIVCGISLFVLFVGVITRNPFILYIFTIIFIFDMIINLIMLYDIIQFSYFLSQLILLFIVNYYRILISRATRFSSG